MGGPFRRPSDEPLPLQGNHEDPFIFRDGRGNFHMLTHYFATAGGHAFSRDGLSWTFAGSAYDKTISLRNGRSLHVNRRERPQVLMLEGEPAFLYSGVALPSHAGASFTFAQEIVRTS